MSVALLLVLNACSASETSPDPREVEADEIDQIVSALASDPTGAVDGVAVDPALTGADGGAVDGPGDRDGRGPRRGDRRGRGVGLSDLILWYGDLTALQACRDEREACVASGATTCDDSARDCVIAVLEGAFDAMCAERTASCAAAGTTDGACGRIIARCEAGLFPVRGDGGGRDGDGGWSGGGWKGGRGDRDHDGRGGRNCDGGHRDDDDDDGDDEQPPAGADASAPAP